MMSSSYYNLAAAITQAENSQWPNNPGALEDTSGNKLTFPSVTDGFNALVNKLGFDASGNSSVYSPNMTLSQFANTYSGGDPNYAGNLANMLGVSTNTPLSQLSDQALGAPDASGTGATGSTSTGPQVSNATSNTSILDTLKAWITNIQNYEADAVAVVIGIVLIAGAIFSFKAVSSTVVTVAKKGAEIVAA